MDVSGYFHHVLPSECHSQISGYFSARHDGSTGRCVTLGAHSSHLMQVILWSCCLLERQVVLRISWV